MRADCRVSRSLLQACGVICAAALALPVDSLAAPKASAKPPKAGKKKKTEDVDPPVITHEDPGAVKAGKVRIPVDVQDASPLFAVVFHWRYVGEAAFRQVELAGAGGKYAAELDVTGPFEFWIEAFDEKGNGPGLDGSEARPVRIEVAAPPKPSDNTPPIITHALPPGPLPAGKVTIPVRIEDASAIFGPTFNWRPVGEQGWRPIPLQGQDGNYGPTFEVLSDFEFWVEAYDEHGNGPANDGTAAQPVLVKVEAAAIVPEAPVQSVAGPIYLPRVHRVATARPVVARQFAASFGGFFATGSDFLLPATSLTGLGGDLSISYGVTDFLAAGLRTGLRKSDLNPTGTATSGAWPLSMSSLGDTALGVRAVSSEFGPLRMAGELWLELPASVDAFPNKAASRTDAGSAVNLELAGVATIDVGTVRVHLQGGYRMDNTELLLPGNWSSFTAYALNLSRYDRVSGALAVEVPLGLVTPFVEYSIDVPVNRRRFSSCETQCPPPPEFFPAQPWELPQRAGLGARAELMNRLAVHLAAEIALTPAGSSLADTTARPQVALDGFAPPPPVALWLGATYLFGAETPAPAPAGAAANTPGAALPPSLP